MAGRPPSPPPPRCRASSSATSHARTKLCKRVRCGQAEAAQMQRPLSHACAHALFKQGRLLHQLLPTHYYLSAATQLGQPTSQPAHRIPGMQIPPPTCICRSVNASRASRSKPKSSYGCSPGWCAMTSPTASSNASCGSAPSARASASWRAGGLRLEGSSIGRGARVEHPQSTADIARTAHPATMSCACMRAAQLAPAEPHLLRTGHRLAEGCCCGAGIQHARLHLIDVAQQHLHCMAGADGQEHFKLLTRHAGMRACMLKAAKDWAARCMLQKL